MSDTTHVTRDADWQSVAHFAIKIRQVASNISIYAHINNDDYEQIWNLCGDILAIARDQKLPAVAPIRAEATDDGAGYLGDNVCAVITCSRAAVRAINGEWFCDHHIPADIINDEPHPVAPVPTPKAAKLSPTMVGVLSAASRRAVNTRWSDIAKRGTIEALMKRGLIYRDTGADGWRATPAGRAALDATKGIK